MMTSTILLLLVAAASTIAFSPPAYPSLIARRRRDISTGTKAGSGSGTGAVAFSGSSSSSSSSGAGNGFATGISSRSGYPTNEVGPNSESAGGYNSVNPGAYGYNDFYLPNPAYNNQYGGGYPDFNRFFQEYMGFMQRLAQQQAAYAPNEIHTRGAFGPGDYGTPQNGFNFPGPNNYGGNYGGNFGGHPGNGNGVSASASASLTPRGGFGSASISPPPQGDPGLATRMGSVPSSGDGNFAVFSSSSSGSSDVNGERKSYKEATSVINDNGKVTTFHVSDP